MMIANTASSIVAGRRGLDDVDDRLGVLKRLAEFPGRGCAENFKYWT